MESSKPPEDQPEETGALTDVGELRVAEGERDNFSAWEFCKCDEIFKILKILALECKMRVLNAKFQLGREVRICQRGKETGSRSTEE